MIHIDLLNSIPPAKWLTKAQALEKRLVKAKSARARRNLIDTNQSLWHDSELKQWLSDLSKGKCWYSEATGDGHYWHVDHFRPKHEVKDENGNQYEGYWWLAFDWRNYRFAAAAPNTQKSSVFPVRNNAWACTPVDDIEYEQPFLLDPASPVDWAFLSFDSAGYPRAANSLDNWNKLRVSTSITVLQLRRKALVDGRKKIWGKTDRMAIRARNRMADLERDRPAAKTRLEEAIQDLKQLVDDDAPYSAVARACVQSHGLKWLNDMVGV